MPGHNSPEALETVPAVKDAATEHPVPSSWRPAFESIVESLVAGDYGLSVDILGVEPVPPDTATQIADYVDDYGEVLAPLNAETWTTSVSRWMEGYWDVLVDLRTEGEGASDLVLHARVIEGGGEPRISVGLVYVP